MTSVWVSSGWSVTCRQTGTWPLSGGILWATVEVRSSFSSNHNCCHQNKYGILDWNNSGGGFPATERCHGVTSGEVCMVVSVMSRGTLGVGFDKSLLLFDAPTSNSDWPNIYYTGKPDADDGPPFLSVWLRLNTRYTC